MEQTDCSETSAYKLQTPRNYPKESIQHTEHGESLKSRIHCLTFRKTTIFTDHQFSKWSSVVQDKIHVSHSGVYAEGNGTTHIHLACV